MKITEEELQRQKARVPLRVAGPDHPIYTGGLQMSSFHALRPSTATSPNGTDGEPPSPDSAPTDPMQPAVDALRAFRHRLQDQDLREAGLLLSESTTPEKPETP